MPRQRTLVTEQNPHSRAFPEERYHLFQTSRDIPEGRVGYGGIVYVLQHPHDEGMLKVGTTRNPRKRVMTLETASGVRFQNIFVSGTFPRAKQVEGHMHEWLAPKRGVGEWFSANWDRVVSKVLEYERSPFWAQ